MKQTHVVYVVKEQAVRTSTGAEPMDYSRAMEYGNLEFITAHDLPFYGRSSMLSSWNRDVQDFVDSYDPLNDYIVTTGQPAAIFCIGWVLGRAGKAPRFLVWRREENRYRVFDFDASMPTESLV